MLFLEQILLNLRFCCSISVQKSPNLCLRASKNESFYRADVWKRVTRVQSSLHFCCNVTACFFLGAAALQVDILGRWQVVMGESVETFFGGGVKWWSDVHYPRASNRLPLSCCPPSPPLSSCSWGVLSTIHNAWSCPPTHAHTHTHTSLSWLVPFDNSARRFFSPKRTQTVS